MEAGPPGEPLIARHLGTTLGTQEKGHLSLCKAAPAPKRAQIGFLTLWVIVRVPERQQPKAQAHSEGFGEKEKDEKTCRKRQVLGVSENAVKLKSSLP